MRVSTLSLVATLASFAAAQTPTLLSPAAAANGLGNSNNNIPFSWQPTAYQQVHSLSSFNGQVATTVSQMRLRMGTGFAGRAGNTIDVELWMADSPNDASLASGVFANNEVLGSEVNVLPRQMVSLPTVPTNDWAIAPFMFTTPYTFTGLSHVSWRAIVWGNGNNNSLFTYPLDAWSSGGTSVPNGANTGCAAATGTRATTHSATIPAPGGNATFNGNSYVAAGGLPAVLAIGASGSSWLGITLPFDLGLFGAPGCFVGNSYDILQNTTTQAGTNGTATISLPLPGNASLQGRSFYSQYLFLDVGANALGIFTTNSNLDTVGSPPGVTRIYASGNPTALAGTLGLQYGMAIGLN